METVPHDAEKQLGGFIGKFTPAHRSMIRGVRKELRRRFPSANELVYDNYNFFVIGYCTTERPSDAFISIVASANGVGICFIHGASLPDPKGVLQGSGKQTRFIHLETAAMLGRPEVKALLLVAAARARTPLPSRGSGETGDPFRVGKAEAPPEAVIQKNRQRTAHGGGARGRVLQLAHPLETATQQ